ISAAVVRSRRQQQQRPLHAPVKMSFDAATPGSPGSPLQTIREVNSDTDVDPDVIPLCQDQSESITLEERHDKRDIVDLQRRKQRIELAQQQLKKKLHSDMQ
ncbi:unnamed protein product, partial [Meganyctiphanes norvegica]